MRIDIELDVVRKLTGKEVRTDSQESRVEYLILDHIECFGAPMEPKISIGCCKISGLRKVRGQPGDFSPPRPEKLTFLASMVEDAKKRRCERKEWETSDIEQ